MSGGHWNYQSHRIYDAAIETKALLLAASDSEHVIDWALCGDTSEAEAKEELWKLWIEVFDRLYGAE